MQPLGEIEVIVATNRDDILDKNLLASPDLKSGRFPITQLRGYFAAGAAYNKGLSLTGAPIVVFVHQDVFLPAGWFENLVAAISQIETRDPHWGVIGLFGIDDRGQWFGRLWSTGLGRAIGEPLAEPMPVETIDEVVIVLRRESGLRFDESLPGFHLYGTDIVQQARTRSLGTYVIDAPVIHNSVRVRTLFGTYHKAYRYMRAKWWYQLPINTVIAPITRSSLAFYLTALRNLVLELRSKRSNNPVAAPEEIARMLGY